MPSRRVVCLWKLGLAACALGAGCSKPAWVRSGDLHVPRRDVAAALLPDGRVLLAGGLNRSGGCEVAEVYDPSSGAWSITGSNQVGRQGPTLTALSSGKVLLVGGTTNHGAEGLAEVFDPANGTWAPAGILSTPRVGHAAAVPGE